MISMTKGEAARKAVGVLLLVFATTLNDGMAPLWVVILVGGISAPILLLWD